MAGVSSYRDLKVWQVAMDVAEQVYQLSAAFPKQETYGLSSQLQRAAVSIPSNIAEGHSRDSTREYLRHLSIASGSLAELETQLLLAHRLKYVENVTSETLLDTLDELGRMIKAIQKSLKFKLSQPPPTP